MRTKPTVQTSAHLQITKARTNGSGIRNKFNFLAPKGGKEAAPVVRVRASARDKFAGLRGHDYVKARGLDVHLPRHGDDVPPSHPSWLLK